MDNVAGIFPLTPMQSGMVYHSLREGTTGAYIVQYTCEYIGSLDALRLRNAWAAVLDAHPILRTAFLFEGLDEPLQVVRAETELDWSELDWSDVPTGAQAEHLERYLAEDRRRGFALEQAPLMRLMLARLAPERHRLVWTYHHAIADGWSSVVLCEQVMRRYSDPAATLETPGSFGDFANWLRTRSSEDGERLWRDRLDAAPLPTRLGFARPATADHGGHGRVRITLDSSDSGRVREFAKAHRLTLSTVTHGAWALTLSGCAGSTEVVYGATVAGRPASFPHVEQMVGPFLNSLPVRVDTAANDTLTAWLAQLQEQLLELREQELTPLADIARWSGVRAPDLFQALLVFESAPPSGDATAAAGLEVVDEEYFDQSNYPFALLVHPKESIELHAVFKRDHMNEAVATRVLGMVAELLRTMPDGAMQSPADLVPPGGEERAALLGPLADGEALQGTPIDVVEAFFDQAAREPTRPAVCTPEAEWSYGKLRQEVELVRRALETRGVGPGDRVALLVPKSPEHLAGVFGTLACGASFVPIDPAQPDSRITEILRASKPAVVLAMGLDEGRPEAWGMDPEAAIQLPLDVPSSSDTEIAGSKEARPPVDPDGPAEAYLLFTSGSSGVPKGVAVSRSNLAFSTAARTIVYGAARPRFLLLSPVGFDSSLAGAFWPLTCGGAVVIASATDERDPLRLGRFIAETEVTTTLCVPSFYRLLLAQAHAADLASLDTVIVAGEACPPGLVHDHYHDLPGTELVNEYGPTECTVWSTYARLAVGDAASVVPIGRPIPGATVRVLDQAGRLAPIGVAGELWIGGPGVALGYLDVDATKESFLADPCGAEPTARLYRTGDRVRMGPDGVLSFLGRGDDQIKIRGYRIEPGDVEASIEAHLGVDEAVVVAHTHGSEDHARLVAYYVTRDGGPIAPDVLRSSVAERLPEHMVPAVFRRLDAVPRTPRGKVDRSRLPDPADIERGGAEEAAVPASKLERDLAGLWERLLGSPVGVDDSFFDVGGDSLLGIRLLGHIRAEWHAEVSMEALFDNPTVAAMASCIESVRRGSDSSEPGDVHRVESLTGPQPLPPDARRPLSPNQERLWSLIRHGARDARYNLPFAVRLRGPLDVDALRRAIRSVVERHDVLRSAVREDASGPWTETTEIGDIVAVERAPEHAGDQWLDDRLTREAERPLDLEGGRTMRAFVVVLADEEHVLMVVMHHFAADGASFEVFFGELSALYASELTGRRPEVDELRLQYHDFAAWQRARLDGDHRREAEDFWRGLYDGSPSPLQLPRPDSGGTALRQRMVVPESTIDRLTELASVESASPFVVSLAAYGVLMAHLTGSSDIVLCSPAVGRDSEELGSLIGYFNNVLPLRLRVDLDATVREVIRATRKVVLQAHAHQTLPFQDIASLSTTQRLALTRGMFAYHGQPLALPRFEQVDVEAFPVTTRSADFDLGLSILRDADEMVASLDYRLGTLGRISPAEFLGAYLGVLERAVARPDRPCRDSAAPVSLAFGERRHRSVPATRVPGAAPPGETSGLPEDPLELQLAVIWERVLEVRGISASHDFFDLGGHSLVAVQLLDTIEREMGRRLSLSSIVEYPTVAAQARALRSEGWSPPSASLVPMYVQAPGDPLVMLHSFEGHTFLFNELARRVGREVPTYGLQAQGLGEGTLPHSTVEEMATHYLDELERRFGDSPVSLLGMCFGNSLGLEMATRRAAKGSPVRLILIDGAWEHLQEPEDFGPRPGVGARIVRRAVKWLERAGRIGSGVRRAVSGSRYARREAAIRHRTALAWERYTPRPYDGEITLIRAHDTAQNPRKDWHVRAMGRIAQGGLRTVTVPGNHFTILREPHVGPVADAVLGAISPPVSQAP